MWHLKFMNLAFSLVDKASDGKLTLEEISECLRQFSPEHFADVHDAVVEAMEDNHISVTEVLKIASALIL